MARYLNDMLRSYEALVDRIDDVIEFAVEASEEDLILAQQEQMLDGYDREGNRIDVYASPWYADMKVAMNPSADGFVDLRLHGGFQRNIVVNVFGGEVIFDSTDWKTERLVGKYGERIFGLSDFYREKFIDDHLRGSVIREIKKILRA